MLDIQKAEKIVIFNLPKGSKIKSAIEYNDKFLFIAHTPDPLEGTLDPFFSVDKLTRKFRDFSPQNYDNPLEVITKLQEAYRE